MENRCSGAPLTGPNAPPLAQSEFAASPESSIQNILSCKEFFSVTKSNSTAIPKPVLDFLTVAGSDVDPANYGIIFWASSCNRPVIHTSRREGTVMGFLKRFFKNTYRDGELKQGRSSFENLNMRFGWSFAHRLCRVWMHQSNWWRQYVPSTVETMSTSFF